MFEESSVGQIAAGIAIVSAVSAAGVTWATRFFRVRREARQDKKESVHDETWQRIVNGMKQRLDDVEADSARMRTRVVALEEELTVERRLRRAAEDDAARMRGELSSVKSALDESNSKVARLERELQATRATNARLQEEVLQLRREVHGAGLLPTAAPSGNGGAASST